jgi:biopolymer transport protein ExbD
MSEKPLSRFVQPVAVPGRRLMHHIPLKSVRSKVVGGGQRSLNQEIPLIPFIDFLLCIVLFLLASFSASGELPIDPSIKLPKAQNTAAMKLAPIITISGTRVLVDGKSAGSLRMIQDSGKAETIPELKERLTNMRETSQAVHVGKQFPGVAVLQIDSKVSALIVKSVFQTVAYAGYPNVSFMVGARGGPTAEAATEE